MVVAGCRKATVPVGCSRSSVCCRARQWRQQLVHTAVVRAAIAAVVVRRVAYTAGCVVALTVFTGLSSCGYGTLEQPSPPKSVLTCPHHPPHRTSLMYYGVALFCSNLAVMAVFIGFPGCGHDTLEQPNSTRSSCNFPTPSRQENQPQVLTPCSAVQC